MNLCWLKQTCWLRHVCLWSGVLSKVSLIDMLARYVLQCAFVVASNLSQCIGEQDKNIVFFVYMYDVLSVISFVLLLCWWWWWCATAAFTTTMVTATRCKYCCAVTQIVPYKLCELVLYRAYVLFISILSIVAPCYCHQCCVLFSFLFSFVPQDQWSVIVFHCVSNDGETLRIEEDGF